MSRRNLVATLGLAAAVVAIATAAAVTRFPIGATLIAQEVYKPGDGVTLPQVIREVKPEYTAEAKAQKIQGSIWLRIVVLASGDVGDVEITRSLAEKYGLDEQAVKAAKQWKFKPGMKDGKPVPVQVTLELTFTLK